MTLLWGNDEPPLEPMASASIATVVPAAPLYKNAPEPVAGRLLVGEVSPPNALLPCIECECDGNSLTLTDAVSDPGR